MKNHLSDRLFSFSSVPDLSIQNCPAYRTCGHFASHDSCQRYVVDLVPAHNFTLRCVRSYTHALLKDPLVPYSQYSLRFML